MNRVTGCLVFCSLALVSLMHNAVGETFYFDMMHKYSKEMRSKIESMNGNVEIDWPVEGSWEYYNSLIQHDLYRHRSRKLQGLNESYSFAPSNSTDEFRLLGGLHYTIVELGNPNVSFLVVLDTGSDLLWVPCQCKQCASTDPSSYGLQGGNFSVYDPAKSQTSNTITCNDEMCEASLAENSCIDVTQTCNYNVTYVQANTSTSGIIIKDVLHLQSENSEGNATSTPIYFGCGEEQTGAFINGTAAPNGLLGLGFDKISVPSTLSRNGLVSNSFSVCFSASDSSGRLAFGERGRSDLQNTSFVSLQFGRTVYAIATTNATVGDSSFSFPENFIFDTGSSFTLMPPNTLELLGTILNKEIKLTQFSIPESLNYCWNISDPSDLDLLIPFTFFFDGGSNMSIVTPYIALTNDENVIDLACLGVLEASVAIFAHNFMRGYEFFLNRDSASLSWSPTINCSNPNGISSMAPEPSVSGISPHASMVPSIAPTTPTNPPTSTTPPRGTPSTPSPNASSKSTSKMPKSIVYNSIAFILCTMIIKLYGY